MLVAKLVSGDIAFGPAEAVILECDDRLTIHARESGSGWNWRGRTLTGIADIANTTRKARMRRCLFRLDRQPARQARNRVQLRQCSNECFRIAGQCDRSQVARRFLLL